VGGARTGGQRALSVRDPAIGQARGRGSDMGLEIGLGTKLREYLRAHPPRFIAHAARIGAVAGDLGLAHDERNHDLGLAHDELAHDLGCTCGARRFRVLGVPAAMTGGRTGYVLRSVLRVWRELRVGASDSGVLAGRLTPPVMLECTSCGLRTPLERDPSKRLEGDGSTPIEGDTSTPPDLLPPLEALRCRPCRSTTFEAAVASRYADTDLDAPAHGGEEERLDGWRLIVRCRACDALAEPYGATLRSARQRRLDRLYGRDERPSLAGPTR